MRALAASLAGLASCTLVADFPADRLVEQTEVLCSNGVDDDGDGLTDCQDFKCLDRTVCCTVPAVVVEDSFEGSACAAAACTDEDRGCAPDPGRWQRWGAPYPYLCEGALVIAKDFAGCYPVGVLSVDAVKLAPGLRIEARVSGIPEEAGRLDLGLTRQSTVLDAGDPCASVARVSTLAGVVFARHPDGVRFIATVDEVPIAETAAAPGEHLVTVSIADDRTIRYAVDGQPFAASGDALPPELDVDAHVVASGLGSEARLEHIRVITGNQCDVPEAWSPADPFAPVEPPPDSQTWDAFERSFPNAALGASGRVLLRYDGCTATASPLCDPYAIAIGEVAAPAGESFERDVEPLFSVNIISKATALDFSVVESERLAYYSPGAPDTAPLNRCAIDGDDQAIQDSKETVIQPGDSGAWDAGGLCCPAAVDRGGEHWVYYTGRDVDGVSRIGLVIAHDDGSFEPIPDPVLEPGEPGSFDERGVSEPAVIFDDGRQLWRMWYLASGAFGAESIGYAVSTDGRAWHRYPRPVLTPEAIGLVSVGSPTLVDDGGRLRLWVHGRAPGAPARTIYELARGDSASP